MSLLEKLRNEVGLTMGGSYPPQPLDRIGEGGEVETVTAQKWFGWTTDEAKADAAREAGAVVTTYRASDPRYNGWEVSVTEIRS